MSVARLRERCESGGVSFVPHGRSWLTTTIGWSAEQLSRFPRWSRWCDWRKTYWITFGRTIYHPDWVRDPLAQDPIRAEHELVHSTRQRSTIVAWWVFRYVTSWRYRFVEEAIAFLVDIRAGKPALEVCSLLRDDYGIRHTIQMMSVWFADRIGERDT